MAASDAIVADLFREFETGLRDFDPKHLLKKEKEEADDGMVMELREPRKEKKSGKEKSSKKLSSSKVKKEKDPFDKGRKIEIRREDSRRTARKEKRVEKSRKIGETRTRSTEGNNTKAKKTGNPPLFQNLATEPVSDEGEMPAGSDWSTFQQNDEVAAAPQQIQAVKLNDYLREKGHNIPSKQQGQLDDDFDFEKSFPLSKTAAVGKGGEKKGEKTTTATATTLKKAASTSFLPRNLSLKSTTLEKDNGTEEAVVPVVKDQEESGQNVGSPPKKRKQISLSKVLNRIEQGRKDVGGDEDEYKPPGPLRPKRGTGAAAAAAEQDDEDEQGVFLGKKVASGSAKANSSKKIAIGALKSAKTIQSTLAVSNSRLNTTTGEEGEIVHSEEENEATSDDDMGLMEETDGELKESDDEKKRKDRKSKKRKKAKRRRRRHSSRSRSRSLSPRSKYQRDQEARERRRERSSSPSARPMSEWEYKKRRRQEDKRALWPWSKGRRSPNYYRPKRRHHYQDDEDRRDRKHRSRSPRRRRRRSRTRSADEERRDKSSPTPRDEHGHIDKKKLFEIARRNASAMLQVGSLQQIRTMSSDEIAKLKAGGRSIDELVEFCRKLQHKQERKERKERGEALESSSDSDLRSLDSEEEQDFLNHPFILNPNTGITLNIPNAVPLPTKTPAQQKQAEAQLRLTFPVSSGKQHQEKEWEPVVTDRPAILPPPPPPPPNTAAPEAPKALPAPAAAAPSPPQAEPTVATTKLPDPVPAGPSDVFALGPPPGTSTVLIGPSAPPTESAATVFKEPPLPVVSSLDFHLFLNFKEKLGTDFTAPTDEKWPPTDISSIVSQRLEAVKRLQDNPNDSEALKMMHVAEEQLKQWAESKNLPGAFTGTTGVQCLSSTELGPVDRRFEAWARKDQLSTAKALDGGVGMHLLQKMGWKPGEGLGKNKEGTREPLSLDVKADRKGLVAIEEMPASRIRSTQSFGSAIQGKHPVSSLMELCNKRRWGPPKFTCLESGPCNSRRFLWKVTVNGVEYQPAVPSNNKKIAKAQSAQVVLQSLGLIPRDQKLPVVIG